MAAVNARSGDGCRRSAPSATMIDRESSRVASVDADLAPSEMASAAALTTYAGGKNGQGIWQRLISLMPPHDIYIEPFLGSAAILRRKKPASSNIGIDVDAGVIATHNEALQRGDWGGDGEYELSCHDSVGNADSMGFVESYFHWKFDNGRTVFVYADPPYYGRARARSDRDLYKHEMLSPESHARLLRVMTSIPALVMISGYRCRLYDRILKDWQRVDYMAMTRGGLKPECAWMNYPAPTELHDYRFLGSDYHDRLRIQRKIGRWVGKLRKMSPLERAAVLAAINTSEP